MATRTSELLRRRLAAQRLMGNAFANPAEAIEALGAVQAQDYAGAKWALGMRCAGATDTSIEGAVDRGDILRTHVLRPTWHLVAAADLNWMLALTAPRVAAVAASVWRSRALDDAFFKRTNRTIAKALSKGEHLTRDELADALGRARIDVGPSERMTHIVMRAELDAIICSGARRGKQSTYALLEARVAKPRQLKREEALRELAIRYFSTRGPATAKDFSWWSGLTVSDARKGAALAGDRLQRETILEQEMWFSVDAPTVDRRRSVHLLPNYDEFLVAYADRSPMAGALGSLDAAETKRAIFSNVIEIDGQVAGMWTRTLARKKVAVDLGLRRSLKTTESRAIVAQVKRYGEFLGLDGELLIPDSKSVSLS